MSRRNLQVSPILAMNTVRNQLRAMVQNYDLAELAAQAVGADMVALLTGFAFDVTLEPEFRAKCANDVLDRGFGKPATKARVEMLDMRAPTIDGKTIGDEITAAQLSAELFQQVDDLVRREVPPEQWPEHVRAAVGDAAAFFDAEITVRPSQ